MLDGRVSGSSDKSSLAVENVGYRARKLAIVSDESNRDFRYDFIAVVTSLPLRYSN